MPLRRPVRRAAMRPTFCPAEARRLAVEGCPMCWWLPPPKGCSTGFIATPRTWGHSLRFTRYLKEEGKRIIGGGGQRAKPSGAAKVFRSVAYKCQCCVSKKEKVGIRGGGGGVTKGKRQKAQAGGALSQTKKKTATFHQRKRDTAAVAAKRKFLWSCISFRSAE